jgi:hypothetical protein
LKQKRFIAFDLYPVNVDVGIRTIVIRLQNLSTRNLTDLDIRLHSRDSYAIGTYATGKHMSTIKPEEQVNVKVQISAYATAKVYISLSGLCNNQPYHWQSPGLLVKVGEPAAELFSLFAFSERYLPVGESIAYEATVRSHKMSDKLVLELWAEKPDGDFEELAMVKLKKLALDEHMRFEADFTPRREDLYTIHAYIFEGTKRIGYEVDSVYARIHQSNRESE